jgi:hypothetical protein
MFQVLKAMQEIKMKELALLKNILMFKVCKLFSKMNLAKIKNNLNSKVSNL